MIVTKLQLPPQVQADTRTEAIALQQEKTRQLLAADRKRAADTLLQIRYSLSQYTTKIEIS
jgi:hypothetical protein